MPILDSVVFASKIEFLLEKEKKKREGKKRRKKKKGKKEYEILVTIFEMQEFRLTIEILVILNNVLLEKDNSHQE